VNLDVFYGEDGLMKLYIYFLIAIWLLALGHVDGHSKFATHGLIIINDISERADAVGAVLNMVGYAFTNTKVPLMLPGRLLYEYIENPLSSFSSYGKRFQYFLLPRGGLGNIQFVLCMPDSILKHALGSTIINDLAIEKVELTDNDKAQEIFPAVVTESEEKYGILLDHFKRITVDFANIDSFKKMLLDEEWMLESGASGNGNRHPAKQTGFGGFSLFSMYLTSERAAQSLRYVLKRLFVPRASYTKEEAALWVLCFAGHGSQYEAETNSKRLEVGADFLRRRGDISCLDSRIFGLVISELSRKISIRMIDIFSCFGGGINLGDLLRDVETGVIPPYNFILGGHTVVGDATIDLTMGVKFEHFFDTFLDLDFKAPEVDWEKVSPEKSSLEQAYKILQTAYDKVYAVLATAYKNFMPALKNATVTANNLPVYKPIETNYFVEIPFPWLMRIGKKEKEGCKGLLQIPKGIKKLLLYATTIPCTLKFENWGDVDSFISAIPGDTFHSIERLEGTVTADELIRKFCVVDHLEAIKYFYIKKVDHIKLMDQVKKHIDGPGSVIVKLDRNDVSAIVFSEKDGACCQLEGKWEGKKNVFGSLDYKVGEFKIEATTKEEWLKVLEDLDKEIIMLKKIAQAQSPYRFLKDADIDLLPWGYVAPVKDDPKETEKIFQELARSLHQIATTN